MSTPLGPRIIIRVRCQRPEVALSVLEDREGDERIVEFDIAESPGPEEKARELKIRVKTIEREKRTTVSVFEIETFDRKRQEKRIQPYALDDEGTIERFVSIGDECSFDDLGNKQKADNRMAGENTRRNL